MRATHILSALTITTALSLNACGPANQGVPGSSDVVTELPIKGTVFTIVFENHGAGAVLDGTNPYITKLAERYATGDAYLANVHPSLPNYLMMTSGSAQGVGDDAEPAKHPLAGTDNLGAQLDAANVPWRAYMEDMGEPCKMVNDGEYAVRHNPFVYYTSLTKDKASCEEHIVDMADNLDADLADNEYKFMWITPNLCNDMHDCPPSTSDEWLSRIIPKIMDSPGYRAGGAIFLLWDEGSTDASYVASYVFKVPQNVPFILVSEHLVSKGFQSNTTYGHDSYLATMEDLFGMPRLPTTVDSTPMADFFGMAPEPSVGVATGAANPSGG